MEAATSGPPLVLGTVISLADHPGIYTAQGEGERGGKAPPPPPPIGPPPGIPTVITCPEGATEEKVKGYKPLLVSVSTSRCLSPLLPLGLLATPFLMNLRLNFFLLAGFAREGDPDPHGAPTATGVRPMGPEDPPGRSSPLDAAVEG